MSDYDAIVVGGGPAGSTAARELCRRGIHTALFDGAEFPRTKLCAGWVTPPVFHLIGLSADEYGRGRTMQPIHGFHISVAGRRAVDALSDQPVSFGILRSEFDDYLLRRCGAELHLGEAVRTIERRGSDWLLNNCYTSRVLVGAGGHTCPVARSLGATPGKSEQAIYAREVEHHLTADEQEQCRVEGHVPLIDFHQDLRGYNWCFRKGDAVNMGSGRETSRGLSSRTDRLVRELIDAKRIPSSIPTRFRGHAYLLYGSVRRTLTGDGVILVGDAAGVAHPMSGEGIRQAIESATIAARVLGGAGGNYGSEQLRQYESLITRRFGSPAFASLPRRILALTGRRLGGAILGVPWFMRHVVVNRWFLQVHRAELTE